MKVCLQTRGPTPKAGGRVRVCGLLYLVASAESPTNLDDDVSITECDIQPADRGPKGSLIIDAILMLEKP